MGRIGRIACLSAAVGAAAVACDIQLGGTLTPVDASAPLDASEDTFVPETGARDGGSDAPRDAGSPDVVGGDADGSPPPPLDAGALPPTVYPHQDWVDFCIGATGCNVLALGMSDCVSKEPPVGAMPTYPREMLQCVKGAKNDCNAIRACMNNGDPSNTTCLAGATPTCNGTVLTSCSSGVPATKIAIDCARLGLVCASGGLGVAACAFADCAVEGESSCVSGLQATCTQGHLVPKQDCRAFQGAACTPLDGGAGCYGNSSPCSIRGSTRCSGIALYECLGGEESYFDCSGRGLLCVDPTASGKADCAYDNKCDPATYVDSCSGNKLTFCNDGRVDTYNCPPAGWATCNNRVCSN